MAVLIMKSYLHTITILPLLYTIIIVSRFYLFYFISENPFEKCSIKNDRCMGREWEKYFVAVGSAGVSELNAAPIDPMFFKQMAVPIVDGVTLTVKDGAIKGFKNCKIPRYQ